MQPEDFKNANTRLKMRLHKVLTEEETQRIMDRLNPLYRIGLMVQGWEKVGYSILNKEPTEIILMHKKNIGYWLTYPQGHSGWFSFPKKINPYERYRNGIEREIELRMVN